MDVNLSDNVTDPPMEVQMTVLPETSSGKIKKKHEYTASPSEFSSNQIVDDSVIYGQLIVLG